MPHIVKIASFHDVRTSEILACTISTWKILAQQPQRLSRDYKFALYDALDMPHVRTYLSICRLETLSAQTMHAAASSYASVCKEKYKLVSLVATIAGLYAVN